MEIAFLKDIPVNIAGAIFMVGLVAGFFASLIFMAMLGGGGSRGKVETPHDIIMAIKRKGGSGSGVGFFQLIGMFLMILLVAVFVFAVVAFGRYWTEGRPGGEEFIPFVTRAFLLPLMKQFPALQNLLNP